LSLWDWSLYYCDRDYDMVDDELHESRRRYQGFCDYRPGFSPTEHRDLLLKRSENRFRSWQLVLGAVVGGLISFLVSHFH